MGPKCGQEVENGAKMGEDGAKMSQDEAKMAENGPTWPKSIEERARTVAGGPGLVGEEKSFEEGLGT